MRIVSILVEISLLLPGSLVAQDFSGVVVKIADGDSMTVLNAQRREIEVRLADIDAPERGQPFSDRSRQALSDLVFQKTVEVRFMDVDSYRRIVGRVYVGDVDVSTEMIRRGLAWAYRQYLRDESLLAVEAEAREARRGLWSTPDPPVPPWEQRRNQAPIQTQRPVSPDRFSCQVQKTVCRQMTSCEEARFYLIQCGIRSLDGDNDGLPCEDRCR